MVGLRSLDPPIGVRIPASQFFLLQLFTTFNFLSPSSRVTVM